MSEDQEIRVEDLCTEKKYFSQIPNIIHRMGLGPYVVSYYCLLKSIAGDSGQCFTGQKKLASALGCSDRQIRKMNAFMSQPFSILGGKPLIKITSRKNEDGECLPNLIHVVDIWVENIMILNAKKPIPKTPMPKTDKVIKEKIVAERSSPIPERSSPPPDPGSYKEEPSIKNPVKKMYSKDLGEKTEIVHKMKKENLDAKRRWKLTSDQHETYLSLIGLDIRDENGNALEEKKLAYWAKNHSLERLIDVYYEAKRYKPLSMKAYMSKLLDENKKVPNANAEANKQFTLEFLEVNPWPGIKIFKGYIKYPLGADFGEIDLNMDTVDFATRFIEKYEQNKEINERG